MSIVDRILKRIGELYSPETQDKLDALSLDVERLFQVSQNLSSQLDAHRRSAEVSNSLIRQAHDIIGRLATLSGTQSDPSVVATLQNLSSRTVSVDTKARNIQSSASGQDTEDATFFRYFFGTEKSTEEVQDYVNHCKTCTSLEGWRAFFRSKLIPNDESSSGSTP